MANKQKVNLLAHDLTQKQSQLSLFWIHMTRILSIRYFFRASFGAFFLLCLLLSACQKTPEARGPAVDAVLIGGGIMSATLGSLLSELDPNLRIVVYEKLNQVALESSSAWNNAGTGHAAYSELNYTPQLPDNTIDIKKAVDINASFEISKQYWAHLVQTNKIHDPKDFINSVPHMSFVWGEKNCQYLKNRFDALTKHPLFAGMEYTEDHQKLKEWFPLIMEGRNPTEKLAATRMVGGTDVDFGSLTRRLFQAMLSNKNHELHLEHEVIEIKRNEDQTWKIVVKDHKSNQEKAINTKFVFIGAGGGSLALLQKSGIEEAKYFGGFPVGGAWLVTENQELINNHLGKVYGQAGIGSPPMSVPHLDTRFINGKRALLFGPFATFSTKFLKTGSWTDLFVSMNFHNFIPVMQVGFSNFDLVRYLIGQVVMTEKDRLKSLQDYMPMARLEDWHLSLAGQRVQVIKKDPEKGGILQFGTELVKSKDGSIVALLGASPGASTAVKAMLNVLETSFKDQLKTPEWEHKIKKMIPSYGQDLADNIDLLRSIRAHNEQVLHLKPKGFLMPDITP